jgi:DNA-directed RNA polymerase subunit RPC12/RpoP
MTDLKIRCDKCGSELTYQPGTETLVCAYCGNTVKIPTQAVKPEDITDTDLIIPLQIQGDALTNATRLYMTQGKLTPDDLVQKATVTKQYLKYVPFYLFHGEYHADWTASFGYERQTGSGSNARTVTDWRPVSGAVNGPFSLFGYAGNGEIDKNCAELLADQDRSKMVPYDAKFLSGFSKDKFALTDRESYQLYVESRVGDMVASEVKANAQGDEQKDWHWSGSQSYDTKTIYLPVGLSVFEYKGKEYKVWVDGVDPSRFTGDPLPEDPHKEQMEYLGWVPFGVTLCFSVMLVMGNGKEAMTGAMRVCNFLWAARSRLIDVGGDSVTK